MNILTVSQINRYVKSVIEYDENLKLVYITGEISNYKPHYSGHMYFTLKDENSEIRGVMFKSAASRLKFNFENGMKIIVRGRIAVYDAKGQYQVICEDAQPDGIGALTIAFEQLKSRLEKEGLFDPENKKSIPQFPNRIGVVTAPTGAAVHDIFSILERRYPLAEIEFVPVAVQGVDAAGQISKAIDLLNKKNACDVMIIGRGGGSIEDLWAFNEEIVARSIFASKIPVISAVGHETDFTIADFVADLRAPTPSAAAELCVPDYTDLIFTIDNKINYQKQRLLSYITSKQVKLSDVQAKISTHNVPLIIENNLKLIETLRTSIKTKISGTMTDYNYKLNALIFQIDSNSPMKILSKGYSVTRDESGKVITSAKSVKSNDKINVTFADGKIECTVN